MNKQPTEKQNREFWEGRGLCSHSWALIKDTAEFPYWLCIKCQKRYPTDLVSCSDDLPSLPDIDLNNLFEYAVPKLSFYNYILESVRLYPHFGGEDVWLADLTFEQMEDRYSPECKVVTAKDQDPALALFWAIWEAIHG